MIRLSAILMGAASAAPFAVQARDIPLAFPVACTLGQSCFIQNYVDRDPSERVADFTCGPLSYDGHQGTDVALPSLIAMEEGVDVLSAAPGVVRGTRDALPDISFRDEAAPDLQGRDCGNGVAIDHGDGWTTQYCHLRQGSVSVHTGQRVGAGQVIGQIGLSGMTEFPHLHFTVRRRDVVVDPFDTAADGACGTAASTPLWREPIAYDPSGPLSAGLAADVPEWEAIKAGGIEATTDAHGALVLWAAFFGGREGDEVRLAISGPEGPVHEDVVPVERTQAQFFRASGLRAPESGWPPGRYEGRAALVRGGEVVDAQTVSTVLSR